MLTQKVKSVRWKRFSHASFATFQSLHREVEIGVLAVAMLSSVSLKASATGHGMIIRGTSIEDEKAPDEDSLVVGLGDVEVLATRVPFALMQAPRPVTVLTAADIAAAAVHSINDLLEYAVGVDVRQRGEFGIQSDISIRGGTFDQITLLLNGVNISSPHTGHLTADFPVTAQDIERIEVLEGGSARVFGTSAFTGVINIVTKKPENTGVEAHLFGGSYGLVGAEGRLGLVNNLFYRKKQYIPRYKLYNNVSGGYSRSDGATPNSDFSVARGYLQGGYSRNSMKIDWQFGYSYKQYGANTFYGAASLDQWESNERYIGALTFENKIGEHAQLFASLNWNRWFDHYQWHKNNPVGENFHKVDAAGGTANLVFNSKWGKTSLGFEARYEGILSTKLGELMREEDWRDTQGMDGTSDVQYKSRANRWNYSAFLEHNFLLKDWTISLGMLLNNNTALDKTWRVYPGLDVSYRPSPHWKLFASWNMALRMPTFTDLYYSGTDIIGTKTLKPEKTNDVNLGMRYMKSGWRSEVSVFYSHKTDMIDWVIYADEPDQKTYRSGNFMLDNFGFEVSGSFLPTELFENSPLRSIKVQYAYLNENINYEKTILKSKYAMEYLRHKIVINADGRLWRNLSLSLSWRWQDRVGEGNLPYALLDGKLYWTARHWSAYFDCSNILNKTYFDYSYIPQPRRWGKIGFKIWF